MRRMRVAPPGPELDRVWNAMGWNARGIEHMRVNASYPGGYWFVVTDLRYSIFHYCLFAPVILIAFLCYFACGLCDTDDTGCDTQQRSCIHSSVSCIAAGIVV